MLTYVVRVRVGFRIRVRVRVREMLTYVIRVDPVVAT